MPGGYGVIRLVVMRPSSASISTSGSALGDVGAASLGFIAGAVPRGTSRSSGGAMSYSRAELVHVLVQGAAGPMRS